HVGLGVRAALVGRAVGVGGADVLVAPAVATAFVGRAVGVGAANGPSARIAVALAALAVAVLRLVGPARGLPLAAGVAVRLALAVVGRPSRASCTEDADQPDRSRALQSIN